MISGVPLLSFDRMDYRETNRLTFAIMAKLGGESEEEIYNFFRINLKGECSYKEAKQAVEDSSRVVPRLPNGPLTTAKVFRLAWEFLAERERLRLEEEEKARAWEWDQPSTRPSSSSRDLLGVVDTPQDDEGVQLAIAASALDEGQFLVRAKIEYVARDPAKEHSLNVGDVFVISQVEGVDDGSDTAWFLGHQLRDSTYEERWICSAHVFRLFS